MHILVVIDISGALHDKILLERTIFSFYVGIEYEKLPNFYNFWKNMGRVIFSIWEIKS